MIKQKPDGIKKQWQEVRELITEIRTKAADLQRSGHLMAEQLTELKALAAEAYAKAPKTDSLFGECLMGPGKIQGAFRSYLVKLGCNWAGFPALDGVHKIPLFTFEIEQACKWLLKFENETIVSSQQKQPGVEELL